MNSKNNIKSVFGFFQDKESFFKEVSNNQSNRLIIKQIIVISLFVFIYGCIMGSYHSLLQSITAGIKLIVLFLSSLIICFPSFFIIQQILGSRLRLRQMMVMILSGFLLSSTIVLSFSTIVIFFLITGDNYHFLQLLHVAIFIFSGIFGMRFIIEALKYACEKKKIYPQLGVHIFRIWIIILAFVGIQLAWNLRPFLSDKNEEFKLFRKYEGNFYTAIVYSVEQLFNKDDDSIKTLKENQDYNSEYDTVDKSDSPELLKLMEK